VIAQAEGETSRFSKLQAEYSKAPEVTRKRLYIEAMESVLSESNTLLVDVKSGNNLMYLPLDKLVPPAGQQASANAGQSVSNSDNQASSVPPVPASPQHFMADEQQVDHSTGRGRDARGRQ